MLAYALGARVYPNEKYGKKLKEIGYYDVELTEKGLTDPLFRDFVSPIKVLQWHGDAFNLPKGTVLLASSKDCTNQAFRHGSNIYGALFHMEFTPKMVDNLVEIDRKWIHENFNLEEEDLKTKAREYKDLMEDQCYKLLDNFIKII